MANLIYICVRDYTEQARQCVRSLRTTGMFDGEVLIFSTRKDEHTLWMANNRLARVWYWEPTWHPRLDRIKALDRPGGWGDGGIMGLDADILAMGDVNPLFDFAPGAIRYQEETWQTYGQLAPGHPTDMYLTYMNGVQRARHSAKHPINIGHYAIPGSMAQQLYDLWWPLAWPECQPTKDVHGADQAAFNAIVRRDLFSHAPWPDGDVMNASKNPQDRWPACRLLHFAGCPDRWNHMKRLSGRR